MSEKKLRTFKIEDDLYLVLQALGSGNATEGLRIMNYLAFEELDRCDSDYIRKNFPMYWAKYCRD